MRRMLDPKEAGGNEKLYCHCIEFYNSSNSKGGRIVINYYSKKKDKYTYDTLNKEFDSIKRIACNGFIHDGNNYFTAFYLVKASNEIHVYYNDTVKYMFSMQHLYHFNFEDNVSEVI